MKNEPNSTSITIEIQRELAEAARLRKANRNDPRIKGIMARVTDLAVARMNLKTA
jgi:hypothetical protein